MSASYHIDAALRLVYTRAWGRLFPQQAMAHARTLGADPRFDRSFRQVIDFRDATDLVGGAKAVRIIAGVNPFGLGARRALVAPVDVVFGLARMYELIVDGAENNIRVVRSLPEAREWLGLPADWQPPSPDQPQAVFDQDGSS